jgi:hypothetical protein
MSYSISLWLMATHGDDKATRGHVFDEQKLPDYKVVLIACMWSIIFLTRVREKIEK